MGGFVKILTQYFKLFQISLHAVLFVFKYLINI